MRIKNFSIFIAGYASATLITAFIVMHVVMNFRRDEKANGTAFMKFEDGSYANPKNAKEALETLIMYVIKGRYRRLTQRNAHTATVLYHSVIWIAIILILIGIYFGWQVLSPPCE